MIEGAAQASGVVLGACACAGGGEGFHMVNSSRDHGHSNSCQQSADVVVVAYTHVHKRDT